MTEIRITPMMLLHLLAERRCDNFTAPSDCINNGRHPLAKYMARLAMASVAPG